MRFVALGARVTICGRRADKLQAVAAELGSACRAVTADIADAATSGGYAKELSAEDKAKFNPPRSVSCGASSPR